MRLFGILLVLLSLFSCRSKLTESNIGASLSDFWVFVGKNKGGQPIIVALGVQKSQIEKKKVEGQSKLFLQKGGEEKLKMALYEKVYSIGDLSRTTIKDPISLDLTNTEEGASLRAEVSRKDTIQLEAKSAPPKTRKVSLLRLAEYVAPATLILNKEPVEGCLVAQRAFFPYTPPEAFFQELTWALLQDSQGVCWFFSYGAQTGAYLVSSDGRESERLTQTKDGFSLDEKSTRNIPSRWEFSSEALRLRILLEASKGHQSRGKNGPSKKPTFYQFSGATGTIWVNNQPRDAIGFVQYLQDD